MDLPNLPPSIVHEPGDEVVFRGSRIMLFYFWGNYLSGKPVEELREYYPDISSEMMTDAIRYYEANRDTVLAFLKEYGDALDRRAAAGPTLDLQALRARRRENLSNSTVLPRV